MLKILLMQELDISFALGLIENEKWQYNDSDLKRLLSLQPDGCFIAWKDGERAGIVSTIIYDDYAFLGMLIVKDKFRRLGIGRELLEHAINHLKDKNIKTIELDGVFNAVEMYRSLGFKDKYLSLRFVKKHGTKSDDTMLYQPLNFEGISEFDYKMTKIARSNLVECYLEEFKDSVFILQKEKIKSYAIVHRGNKGHVNISLFISELPVSAEILLNSILKRFQHKTVNVGVPAINREAVNLFLRKGFIYKEPVLRMYYGERKQYENFLYGIVSPEKG